MKLNYIEGEQKLAYEHYLETNMEYSRGALSWVIRIFVSTLILVTIIKFCVRA